MESLNSSFRLRSVACPRCSPRTASRAFSLIELLIVVSILLLLAALAVNIQPTATNHRLTMAGHRLADLVEQARVQATVSQENLALRFYADPETGDVNSGFRSVRLFKVGPSSSDPLGPITAQAVTRSFRLDEPLLISSAQSSVFQNANIRSGTETQAGEENGLAYREFYFFPDGSTSLAATSPHPYVTLVSRADQGALKNPFVVSLDPLTARCTIFQR